MKDTAAGVAPLAARNAFTASAAASLMR